MTLRERIFPSLKRALRDAAIGVLASVIAGAGFYFIGYDAGYEKGTIKGAAKGAIEARAEILETMKNDEEAHRENLNNLTEEHNKKLEAIVLERYGQALLEEHEKAQRTGESRGYESGLKAGHQEGERACEKRIEGLTMYSRYWEGYSEKIYRYFKLNKETEMRSQAQAVVDIAMQGRESLAAMATQLNTVIEQIDKALKAGDLKDVTEKMRALEATLPQKGEIWRKNYRIITSPVG